MKKDLTLWEFEEEFRDADRDYFSRDGYQFLYDYYSEFPDWELDVVEVCGEWSEYDDDDLISDYDYLVDTSEYEDDDELVEAIARKLENETYYAKLDNGDHMVASF